MPTQRQLRETVRLRADQEALRAAAAWVREQPEHGKIAALSEPTIAGRCADLLDHLADYCDRIDEVTREQVVRVARELVGNRMDRPSVRRTRRRR